MTESYLLLEGTDHFWTDPETGDQWLDTGDIAYITSKGQVLYFQLKKKEFLILIKFSCKLLIERKM